jgi:hypothetical protein
VFTLYLRAKSLNHHFFSLVRLQLQEINLLFSGELGGDQYYAVLPVEEKERVHISDKDYFIHNLFWKIFLRQQLCNTFVLHTCFSRTFQAIEVQYV